MLSAVFSATTVSGPQSVYLPTINGTAAELSFLSNTPGATITGSVSTTPGNGFAPVGGTPVYAATFTTNTTGTIAFGISCVFTLPTAPPVGTRFIVAGYDSRYGWAYGIAGPATVTGNNVIPGSGLQFNATAGVTYGIAVYSVPANAAAGGAVTIASGATITLPTADGAAGALTLGTTDVSTSATVQLFLDPPAIGHIQTAYPSFMYYTFTPVATVHITGTTTGTFTLPSGYTPPVGKAYMAIYDTSLLGPASGWVYAVAGPANLLTGTATFTTTQTITLTGGVTYAVAIYPAN